MPLAAFESDYPPAAESALSFRKRRVPIDEPPTARGRPCPSSFVHLRKRVPPLSDLYTQGTPSVWTVVLLSSFSGRSSQRQTGPGFGDQEAANELNICVSKNVLSHVAAVPHRLWKR